MKRLLLVLLLVGCEAVEPTQAPANGVVVAKTYDDPDTWKTQGACLAYNDGFCTARMPDQTHRDGPHWTLRIYDTDRGTLYDLEVGEGVHDGCRIGAKWVAGRCPA